MLTKEVREWVKKVESKQYSFADAMYAFSRFSSCLTKEELIQLKRKLENSYKS